jgi:formate dehydrogenase subunit gamma
MSANDKKESKQDTLEREVESVVDEETAGLDPAEAGRIREKVRARVLEEVERERRIRTAAERRAEERRRREEKRRERLHEEGEMFERFNRNFRFQHIVMFTSVIILVITGMPIKFPEFVLSRFLVNMWGGIHNATIVHRIGAGMLIYFMVHHLFYTVFSRQGRRDFILLIPTPKDARDAVQNVRHFLGKTGEKPRFGRFSYIEKFDYWAVYWGCVVMIGSGLLLWLDELTMRWLPKVAIDIAHEAHSDEALLATLAILIWHFYNVHLNPDRFPMSWTWIHGKISREEMVEHHPREYEELLESAAAADVPAAQED